MKKNFDWYDDKRLLSMIRGGDYAHAGETEAIDRIFATISKNKQRQILDVGCGLGGTAEYLQQHGFGKVTGLDIDTLAIKYAQEKYPQITFYAGDAADADKLLPHKTYDLIYSLNAFFIFPNKSQVLKNLEILAKPHAQLIIFDYIDLLEATKNTTVTSDILGKTFIPIRLNELEKMMQQTKWRIKKVENLDREFIKWYQDFVNKITNQKAKIIAEFDEDIYLKTVTTFTGIYKALNDKIIGGSTIYAELS
jgi:cyclopropane fatty-acyl-phospholipid synthase-like methyltransferase